MDFSKRRSSKASISIPPTQIPLPRASLNKLPAQNRKPNAGTRGGSHAARSTARATSKRLRAAAACGWRTASSDEEQAASDPSRNPSPEEKQRQKLGRHQARFERALAQQLSSAGCVSRLGGKASQVESCGINCNRES